LADIIENEGWQQSRQNRGYHASLPRLKREAQKARGQIPDNAAYVRPLRLLQ